MSRATRKRLSEGPEGDDGSPDTEDEAIGIAGGARYSKRVASSSSSRSKAKPPPSTKPPKQPPKAKRARQDYKEDTDADDAPSSSSFSGDPSRGNIMGIDPSALQFFKSQQVGAKGIRKELQRIQGLGGTESLRLSTHTYGQFYENMAALDPLTELRPQGRRVPKELASQWMWDLLGNANVLVFGVGDKRPLLEDFAAHYLQGEDVLELNGWPSSVSANVQSHSDSLWKKSVRSLLDTISEEFLGVGDEIHRLSGGSLLTYASLVSERLSVRHGRRQQATRSFSDSLILSHSTPSKGSSSAKISLSRSSSLTATPDSLASDTSTTERERRVRTNAAIPKYGGRYAYCQTRLYLVIHELCGPVFDHPIAQQVLSILAQCDSLSVIASLESLNLPLHWSSEVLQRFRWRYYHMPTYVHHRMSEDHPMLVAVDNTSTVPKAQHVAQMVRDSAPTGEALKIVLLTLTRNHRDFLKKLCSTIASTLDKNSKIRQMAFSDAVTMARKVMIAKTAKELKKLIVELIDHAILQLCEEEQCEQLRVLLSEEDFAYVCTMPVK